MVRIEEKNSPFSLSMQLRFIPLPNTTKDTRLTEPWALYLDYFRENYSVHCNCRQVQMQRKNQRVIPTHRWQNQKVVRSWLKSELFILKLIALNSSPHPSLFICSHIPYAQKPYQKAPNKKPSFRVLDPTHEDLTWSPVRLGYWSEELATKSNQAGWSNGLWA